uniref:Uncharacterized protein n=1 Tax=Arundo donax TaxID=35708 RepID=A0A0A8ZD08_ARUDO
MGRRETMLRRSESGRWLTRSTPPPSESKRMQRRVSAETGGSGRRGGCRRARGP